MIVDPQVRVAEDSFKADAASYRLMTHGVHQLDLARALLGDVEWVSAHAAQAGADHSWHGTMGLAAGGLASFEITASVHSSWSEGVDIYGERGHIRIRSPYAFTRLGSTVELHLEQEGITHRPIFGDTDPFHRQLRGFVGAIRGESTDIPTPADGVAATRLVLAVSASTADGGSRVTP
jgi:predicted dehydrogenase